MKVELTKDWCMNMAKIEARAAELHEGCRMPMEQARELAASEMSEGRKALLAAFGAAAAAREQGLRGQYPKAATVLAEEVFSLRAALRQKQAEYDDMKSLLLGNVRNVHLEGERAREVLRRLLEAPTTQITSTWKDAARFALRLGPDDLAAIERIKDDIKARAAQEAAYLSTDLGDFLLHVIDRCKGEHEWDAVRLNAEALLKRAAIVFGPNVF